MCSCMSACAPWTLLKQLGCGSIAKTQLDHAAPAAYVRASASMVLRCSICAAPEVDANGSSDWTALRSMVARM